MGVDGDQAAQGVLRVASAAMAGAMRAVSVEVGEDPRDGALIAYGGAGPLLASLLARELDIKTVVVPNYAGNFSAWGLFEQDVVRSAALTIVARLDDAGIRTAEKNTGRPVYAARGAGRAARHGNCDARGGIRTCGTPVRSTR